MRRIALSLLAVTTLVVTLLMPTSAAAHGYISSPPSRQALCAQGAVPDCGDLRYEPQSVEAPKGSRLCSGGNTRFAVLDDPRRSWPAGAASGSQTFRWTLTARHATSTWEYFVGGALVARFDDGGRQPGATVAHTVNLGGRTGRHTVLAVWNIADTPMAFYACVDVQIGGGTPPTTPPTTAPPTTTPPTTAPPTTTPPQPGGTWAAGVAYAVGSRVTYGGATYACRQAHTSLAGWEPPNVPALWTRL